MAVRLPSFAYRGDGASCARRSNLPECSVQGIDGQSSSGREPPEPAARISRPYSASCRSRSTSLASLANCTLHSATEPEAAWRSIASRTAAAALAPTLAHAPLE